MQGQSFSSDNLLLEVRGEGTKNKPQQPEGARARGKVYELPLRGLFNPADSWIDHVELSGRLEKISGTEQT